MDSFEVWRDYLGLAKVVQEIQRDLSEGGLQEALLTLGEAIICSPTGPLREKAVCAFCKHNGESKRVYTAHSLKDEDGRVQCPILRNYTCPQCGATRDHAHTRRFCPLTRKGYTSVYSCSSRNSAGKRLPKYKPQAPGRQILQGCAQDGSKSGICAMGPSPDFFIRIARYTTFPRTLMKNWCPRCCNG
uniref:Nanos C2HC-type zinc finger 3 n=1 Tax=Sphenodon punctatus TaxID=8508 RepID=A0A8D0L6Q4_SPHPU